jgi:hypothetical protein
MSQKRIILKNNWTKKYKVKAVLHKTTLQKVAVNYLKKQSYINYNGIGQILKINFDKDFPIGYAVIIKKKIVGFVGTLFSKRKIKNKNYIYCNIHTWVVDRSHRVASHLLFMPLLKKKCIVTVLSPKKRLIGTFEKMGFKSNEMNYKVTLLNIFFNFLNTKSFKIENKLNKIKKNLSNQDLKIYNDHTKYFFKKFIVVNKKNKSDFSLIIAKIVKKKNCFNVLNILYVSNIPFIKENWDSISFEIFKEYKVFFYGQYFLKKEECVFSKKMSVSLNFKRTICVKNLPKDFLFNTIYSESI